MDPKIVAELLQRDGALESWGEAAEPAPSVLVAAGTARGGLKRKLPEAETPFDQSSGGGGGGGGGGGAAVAEAKGSGVRGGAAAAVSSVPRTAQHPRYRPELARLGVLNPEGALASARHIEDPVELVALIAASLRETQEAVLERSVSVLGVVACRELMVAAIEVEGDGGLMTIDGTRRRSPGGVFFELLKQVASEGQYKAIFAERSKEHSGRVNKKRRGGAMRE
jgi:hypothetical protein